MDTLPPLDTFKMADADKPRIGFRVVASGGDDGLQNTLGSRDPQADATSQTLLDHLTWEKVPSPFASLWKSWLRAVKWAKGCANRGAQDVNIVAVWIHDQAVYDGHKAATTFQLSSIKPLNYYKDEVIILGLGDEDNCNILTEFYWVTERKWETVTFVLDGTPFSASLPIGSLEPKVKVSSDEEEAERKELKRWQKGGLAALRHEVFRTGSHDNFKVDVLAKLLCEKPFPTARVMFSRPGRHDIASKSLLALRSGKRN